MIAGQEVIGKNLLASFCWKVNQQKQFQHRHVCVNVSFFKCVMQFLQCFASEIAYGPPRTTGYLRTTV
jgi:hypothetical protein